MVPRQASDEPVTTRPCHVLWRFVEGILETLRTRPTTEVMDVAMVAPVTRVRVTHVVWALVAAAVLVQIAYPLMPAAWRTDVTVVSVVVFFVAAVADAARVHGPLGAAVLVAVAGGGGLIAEAVGVATGLPFGHYAYTGTLGPELFGVPAVV